MNRRYLPLAVLVVVVAVTMTVIGRPRPRSDAPVAQAPEAPVVDLVLAIEPGRVSPELSSVPMGARVRVHAGVRGDSSVTLALAGYEDRLASPSLAPGVVWSGEFLADRPGDDFAWLVDGRPAGRLAVTGSHLIEGHR